MTRENLIPVKSESEIRVGMIVVVKQCGAYMGDDEANPVCGETHRMMILNGPFEGEDGWGCVAGAFDVAPMPPCVRGHAECIAFDVDIPEGHLFRVEDGLDLEAEKRAEQEKPRERVR